MQTYTTGRLTDKQVLNLLDAMAEVNPEASCRVAVAGLESAYPDEISRDDFQTRGTHSISFAGIEWPDGTIKVEFRRGLARDEATFATPRTPSPYFDQIQIQAKRIRNQQNQIAQPNSGSVHRLCELIERHTVLAEPSLTSQPGEAASNVLNQTLAKLSDRFSELNIEAEARRSEAERDVQHKFSEFQKLMEIREAELAAKEEALEREHEARTDELESFRKTLDDRDHMHARRGLREAITSDIQEKLASALIPRTSLVYRLAVLITVLFGAFASGSFALLSYADFSRALAAQVSVPVELTWAQTLTTWMLFGKGAIGSLAAFGFLVYAINWLRKSYNDDLRAHRELERYAIDLNRASWAIETILEANSKEGVQIPDIMIQGVSRNLFGVHEQMADAKTDAIAELLRASAEVKVGPGGAEFKLNSRGTNKLAKEMEE